MTKINASQVAELNSKRTQGEWKFEVKPNKYGASDYGLWADDVQIIDIGNDEQYYPSCGSLPDNYADSELIESVPAMADLIAQQAEVIKVMRDALTFIVAEVTYGGNWDVRNDAEYVVKQALAAAAKLEE